MSTHEPEELSPMIELLGKHLPTMMADIQILYCLFIKLSLAKGITRASLADMIEETASGFPDYSTMAQQIIEPIRTGKLPGPNLTVINGGKSEGPDIK